jgi:hypothetical protein
LPKGPRPVLFPKPLPSTTAWDPQEWRRGFIRDDEIRAAGRNRKRPWLVLCYCSPEGPEHENPWESGKKYWRLLLIKRFETWVKVEESQSYQRNYAPFNHAKHLVVVAHKSAIYKHIVQYKLYDNYR